MLERLKKMKPFKVGLLISIIAGSGIILAQAIVDGIEEYKSNRMKSIYLIDGDRVITVKLGK